MLLLTQKLGLSFAMDSDLLPPIFSRNSRTGLFYKRLKIDLKCVSFTSLLLLCSVSVS